MKQGVQKRSSKGDNISTSHERGGLRPWARRPRRLRGGGPAVSNAEVARGFHSQCFYGVLKNTCRDEFIGTQHDVTVVYQHSWEEPEMDTQDWNMETMGGSGQRIIEFEALLASVTKEMKQVVATLDE